MQNSPIHREWIISGFPENSLDCRMIGANERITFKDVSGVEQKENLALIWGVCKNRSVYINHNMAFYKLAVIGTLSVFAGIVPSGMLFNSHDGMVGTDFSQGPSYTELHQYIFDTRSKRILDLNTQNMEMLLSDDINLLNEFMALKKRERNKMVFVYLRKYNEKHPLYLPVK